MSVILQINAEIEIKSDSVMELLKNLGNIATVKKEEEEVVIDKQEVNPHGAEETMSVEEFTKVENKKYTLEQVRAKLTELSRSGKREEVNMLITGYGVKRLTDIPEKHYEDLMMKAEAI